MDFENKLKQLQIITEKLEDTNLSMDEGIKLYEEGLNIAKDCYKSLNETKGKINILKQDLENYKEESLD